MEGIGEFYGGILHPLLVLPHALSVLVLGLLVGQGGVRAMRFTYLPFIVALAAGLFVAGFQLQPSLPFEKMLLLLAMVCGLLVALQSTLPAAGMALLGALLAFLIGMDSGVSGLSRRETFAALCGCWLGAVLLLILVAGIAEMAHRSWQRVALRVLGSWTAASGALVLALALRPDI
jgi:urease accessory protein